MAVSPCHAPRLSGRLCCASFVAMFPLFVPPLLPPSLYAYSTVFFPPVFVLRNLLSLFYNKCNPSTPSDHAHCCCCCCNKKVLPLDAGQRNPFCAQHEGGQARGGGSAGHGQRMTNEMKRNKWRIAGGGERRGGTTRCCIK